MTSADGAAGTQPDDIEATHRKASYVVKRTDLRGWRSKSIPTFAEAAERLNNAARLWRREVGSIHCQAEPVPERLCQAVQQ